MTETVTPDQLRDEARMNFTRVMTGNTDIDESDAWYQAVVVTAENHGMSTEECMQAMKNE
jgi:hypothetical protein